MAETTHTEAGCTNIDLSADWRYTCTSCGSVNLRYRQRKTTSRLSEKCISAYCVNCNRRSKYVYDKKTGVEVPV